MEGPTSAPRKLRLRDLPLRDRLSALLLTAGGLGMVAVAPGTFGTLGGVVPAIVLGAMFDPPTLTWLLAGLALALFSIGTCQTRAIGRIFGVSDPGAVVLDEVVGYLVVVAIDSWLHGRPLPTTHAVAFLLFRIFDILKPPPIRRFEEMPGALGVMADDVMAGVYAALVLLGVHALGLP
ncbi:MAG: phosphatidylglycerophosphatase A [Planctomycetota bacterium]